MKFLLLIAALVGIYSAVDAVQPDDLMRAAVRRDTENRARGPSSSAWQKTPAAAAAAAAADDDDDDDEQRRFTSQRCCKVGQHLARQRMDCSADMWYVERKNNRVHAARLKLHEPGSVAKTFGKDLALKAAKCHNHKATFEKCCRWRQSFMQEMEACKTMKGAERRVCRRTVRTRY